MKIHHLSCATMCPVGRAAVNGTGGLFERGRMVCHCLLVETESSGLVLVDSGLGTLDLAKPAHLGAWFLRVTAPTLDPRETARAQVVALGYAPEDVRHVVVTHLDLDHAGGIPDFPWARVHVHAAEHAAALARATLLESERYKPLHWAHGPDWALYSELGESWFGFERVRGLEGLPPEIVMIPLHGHSRGHAGIGVKDGDRWLLHAGDAYFFRDEIHATPPRCPPGLRAFQRIAAIDDAARRRNQARLRELSRAHGREVAIFSAHDPVELEAFDAR